MKKMILFCTFLMSLFLFTACQSDDAIEPCVADPQEDCICTEEYFPVCGCNEQTYSNACEAECDGIYDYTTGPCR